MGCRLSQRGLGWAFSLIRQKTFRVRSIGERRRTCSLSGQGIRWRAGPVLPKQRFPVCPAVTGSSRCPGPNHTDHTLHIQLLRAILETQGLKSLGPSPQKSGPPFLPCSPISTLSHHHETPGKEQNRGKQDFLFFPFDGSLTTTLSPSSRESLHPLHSTCSAKEHKVLTKRQLVLLAPLRLP